MVRVRKPSFRRPFPHGFHCDCEALPVTASRMSQRRNKTVVMDEEGRVKPEDRLPVKTLERPFFEV